MVLQYLTIPSANLHNHSSTCFILHGLGDSGNGWAQVAQILSRKFPFTKFILPHAPNRRITLNQGYSMPAWYDLIELKSDSHQDKDGILQSAKEILELVDEEEKKGIPKNKIVIGGFSQGGAIAFTTGLLFKSLRNQNNSNNSAERFAGIMALSTYIPIKEYFEANKEIIPIDTPIYMSHGTQDQVVSFQWGQASKAFLNQELSCKNIKFESISNLGHSVNNDVIESMIDFLHEVFSKESDEL